MAAQATKIISSVYIWLYELFIEKLNYAEWLLLAAFTFACVLQISSFETGTRGTE